MFDCFENLDSGQSGSTEARPDGWLIGVLRGTVNRHSFYIGILSRTVRCGFGFLLLRAHLDFQTRIARLAGFFRPNGVFRGLSTGLFGWNFLVSNFWTRRRWNSSSSRLVEQRHSRLSVNAHLSSTCPFSPVFLALRIIYGSRCSSSSAASSRSAMVQ